jgi:hypothetical protein
MAGRNVGHGLVLLDERGAFGVNKFKSIGRQVWERGHDIRQCRAYMKFLKS